MARELNVGWAIAPNVVNLSFRPNLWAGPTLGFTNIQQNAIVYLSREIAEKAAKIVFASLKKGLAGTPSSQGGQVCRAVPDATMPHN